MVSSSRPGEKMKVLRTFKCEDDMWEELGKLAGDMSAKFQLNITRSDLIREAIKKLLKEVKNGDKR